MKNPDFFIVYKESLFGAIGLVALILLATPLFIFAAYENINIFDGSELLNRTVLICLVLGMWIGLVYGALVIVKNINRLKEISYKDGTLKFTKSPLSHIYIEVNASEVTNAYVANPKNSGVKILFFSHNGREYGINDSSFDEKEFSLICNAIVKLSKRCKACQSTQVSWSLDKGHCHNCETLTPINADDFDWDDAYKA